MVKLPGTPAEDFIERKIDYKGVIGMIRDNEEPGELVFRIPSLGGDVEFVRRQNLPAAMIAVQQVDICTALNALGIPCLIQFPNMMDLFEKGAILTDKVEVSRSLIAMIILSLILQSDYPKFKEIGLNFEGLKRQIFSKLKEKSQFSWL